MKKLFYLLLASALLAFSAGADCWSSPQEITIESILQKNTPRIILAETSGYRIDMSYSGTGDETLDEAVVWTVYAQQGGILYCTQSMDYNISHYAHLLFCNDPEDAYWYYASHTGNEVIAADPAQLDACFDQSALGYEEADGADGELVLVSCDEADGLYTAVVEFIAAGEVSQRDTLTLDPATGRVLESVTEYPANGVDSYVFTQTFRYDDAIVPDLSPKEAAVSAAEKTLTFAAEDLDGNIVTQEDIRDARVVMINLWEPWCGPCVQELPALQRLYETYADQGLLILGVFSDLDEEASARELVSQNGISYPILKADDALAALGTQYVPTTRFFDGQGHVLVAEPAVGSNSYEGWEAVILELLGN